MQLSFANIISSQRSIPDPARQGRAVKLVGCVPFFKAYNHPTKSWACLCDGLSLIQVLLESGEHLADFLGAAQIGYGIGDGVVIFQP
jgi:hypothetical protein